MELAWEFSRRAFADAARWFAKTAAAADGRWGEPGLGEWDIRALVGHTSRALLTVEKYLDQPADFAEIDTPAGYFRATGAAATDADVAERGRAAGNALGPHPHAAVAQIVQRVVPLVEGRQPDELISTIAGGMRLDAYLPTRTFELTVHTIDLETALGQHPDPARCRGRMFYCLTRHCDGKVIVTVMGMGRCAVKLPPYSSLESLPGVGATVAGDYRRLGVRSPDDVAAADPYQLYARLEGLDGPTDRCMLYTFRCAHYAASTASPDPDLLAWWRWTGSAGKDAPGTYEPRTEVPGT
jgi:hypothetical protein